MVDSTIETMRQLILVLFVVVVTVSALPASTNENSKQLVTNIDVDKNGKASPRTDKSLEDIIEDYVKENELNFKSGREVEARKKKSKIKKAFVPILVFILIKAIILIPLALAILGFKTWNAIQLSFVSFVTAAGLAIWKFCTKINHDDHPAIVHNAWDPHLDRTDGQQLAYGAYAPVQ
ncbi:hypothetical protein JTB14_009695 [Gonioctena quinquepunctata]|nr:hypothetical protein JTB14_009695 [Gonioctena quinquepunctata]